MKEFMKVAKNNIEEHGSNYVRATIENEILDDIIAGKPSQLVVNHEAENFSAF